MLEVVRHVLEHERGMLIVPAPVTTEADYLLRERVGRNSARSLLQDIANGRFQVEGLTREEHGLALAVHDQYADLDLGLADLSVVVLAHRFHSRRLLTFDDRHFRAIRSLTGDPFVILPADET